MQIKLPSGEISLIDELDYENFKDLPWFKSSHGYVSRDQYLEKVDGKWKKKRIYLHREITGNQKGVVDHINGNKLDNRKSNLRVCSVTENLWNRGANKGNISGHRGVTWDKTRDKWRVRFGNKQLGRFQSLDEAIEIKNKWLKNNIGEFANLN